MRRYEYEYVISFSSAGRCRAFWRLLWYVLQVIACWRLFTKAGEAGWKSIIPIYNNYMMYKIVWQTKFFWISLVLSFAVGIVNATLGSSEGTATAALLVLFVIGILQLILTIMYCNKTAKAYGKGGGFAVGLLLLQPIFMLILGLGDSEYLGADR